MTRVPVRSASKPQTIGAFGAKGTGKTTWILGQLRAAKPPRLLVWDYKGDPLLADLGREHFDLWECIRAMKGARFALRYRPTHDGTIAQQFEYFCRAAWAHGQLTIYVPELPEVTAANRAPQAWRTCVNVGREYSDREGRQLAIGIYADGQRIAECDKSFIHNLDVTHCGRMGNVADAKTVAAKLGCDWRELLTLPDFAWIERRPGTPAPLRGVLNSPRAKNKSERPATVLRKPS